MPTPRQPLQTAQGAAGGCCPAVLWPSFRAESAEPRNPASASHTDHCCDSSTTFARHQTVLTRVRDKDRAACGSKLCCTVPASLLSSRFRDSSAALGMTVSGDGANTRERCWSNADDRHCIAQSDSLCLRRNVETTGTGFQPVTRTRQDDGLELTVSLAGCGKRTSAACSCGFYISA